MAAKSGKGSRDKGGKGEREFLKALGVELGITLERNLQQSRSGGADCLGLESYAIEVKRCEQLQLKSWWVQSVEQAADDGRVPVLAYRQNRHPWRVIVPLHHIDTEIEPSYLLEYTATVSISAFAFVASRGKYTD